MINSDLRETRKRMLNAIEPGSPQPIHRHRHTSETVVCLRGRLVWEYYQELRDEGLELKDSSKSSKSSRDRAFAQWAGGGLEYSGWSVAHGTGLGIGIGDIGDEGGSV